MASMRLEISAMRRAMACTSLAGTTSARIGPNTIFTRPKDKRTEDYVTGRFG